MRQKIRHYFSHLPLRNKWALTSSAVIFISYAVICIIMYAFIHNWLLADEQAKAQRTMDDLLTMFVERDHQLSIQQLNQNTGLLNAMIDKNQTVYLVTMDEQVVVHFNSIFPHVAMPEGTSFEKMTLQHEPVFVANRYIKIGFFEGYVQLIHPLTSFEAMMKYLLTAMLLGGLGALLLSGSIGYYLANMLMKPVTTLRNSMQQVANEGFTAPINLTSNSQDELGELLALYNDMMQQLQLAFQQQNQFVSDASHELRTPIQSIEGHLSLIKRWGKDDKEVLEESIDTALAEIARMRQLIEELLALARHEPRDVQAEADVALVVQDVVATLQEVYPQAQFDIAINEKLPLAAISANALMQILRNLCINAIHYTKEPPRIKIHATTTNNGIALSVKDNGIGISAEQLPYIFDRFYRVDDARTRFAGGNGLGLSITKVLAERYNAEISVHSEIDTGTEFILQILVK